MTARLLTLATTAGVLLAGALGAPASAAQHEPPGAGTVTVTGAVATPITYSVADLAGLAQTALPDLRNPRREGREVTGTLLAPLVTASAPVLPAAKNAQLRVTVTVVGRDHQRVAVALGELVPTGGNHPALLVAEPSRRSRVAGVDLVFPGDRGTTRTVRRVTTVEVAVAAPALPAGVPAGALRIVDGRRTVTLSAETLRRLPAVTRDVAFGSGQGPQQHTETGPTLAAVLRAARVRTGPTTTVAAIAGDGYVATVTPAEATAGRRPLLLATLEDGVALTQPRLVTDGDVFGGRYVTGVLALEVSSLRGC